jgi:chromosome segregation ATPase
MPPRKHCLASFARAAWQLFVIVSMSQVGEAYLLRRPTYLEMQGLQEQFNEQTITITSLQQQLRSKEDKIKWLEQDNAYLRRTLVKHASKIKHLQDIVRKCKDPSQFAKAGFSSSNVGFGNSDAQRKQKSRGVQSVVGQLMKAADRDELRAAEIVESVLCHKTLKSVCASGD